MHSVKTEIYSNIRSFSNLKVFSFTSQNIRKDHGFMNMQDHEIELKHSKMVQYFKGEIKKNVGFQFCNASFAVTFTVFFFFLLILH